MKQQWLYDGKLNREEIYGNKFHFSLKVGVSDSQGNEIFKR